MEVLIENWSLIVVNVIPTTTLSNYKGGHLLGLFVFPLLSCRFLKEVEGEVDEAYMQLWGWGWGGGWRGCYMGYIDYGDCGDDDDLKPQIVSFHFFVCFSTDCFSASKQTVALSNF